MDTRLIDSENAILSLPNVLGLMLESGPRLASESGSGLGLTLELGSRSGLGVGFRVRGLEDTCLPDSKKCDFKSSQSSRVRVKVRVRARFRVRVRVQVQVQVQGQG